MILALGLATLLAWLYLTFLHGRFWHAAERLGAAAPRERWPAVTAVVPARDEATVIEASLASLLDQDYAGDFTIVLVDDHSTDGTAEIAQGLAAEHPRGERLTILEAPELPAGWVGKMWAVHNGVAASRGASPEAHYLLLTDADVAHSPSNLRRLVARAESEERDLVSLMVLLDCRRGVEKLLIPAFVYFFQMLYPFKRVADPRSRIAGAAGGCMLVRAAALEEAGGIAAIRGEIIDDCALARRIKHREIHHRSGGGSIWLGLTESERSLRPYDGLGEIWNMVARTAYTQLGYSPLVLLGTVLGLALLYLLPPFLVLGAPLHGAPLAALAGALAWLLMAVTFVPTLRLYRRSPLWGLALPAAGVLYLGMTLDSAWRHWRGRGAGWKGRTHSE